MSKIGKINISIPEKVKVVLTGNNLNIEGPLGKKSINVDLNEGIFNGKIELFVSDTLQLSKLIKKLQLVPNVNNVTRLDL